MRSWFGVKKDAAAPQPSTSSVTRRNNEPRAETADTILSLREGIATQEKRWVFIWWKKNALHSPHNYRALSVGEGGDKS